MSLALSNSKPRELQYAPGGLREDLVLLEVTEDLLSTIEREGVVIKGAAEDQAVLCTHDKTYALKSVETTNLLLLIPPNQEADAGFREAPSQDIGQTDIQEARDAGLQMQLQKAAKAAQFPPLQATSTAVAHMEVSEIPPRLSRLKGLLGAPYTLADEEAAAAAADGELQPSTAAAASRGGGSGGADADGDGDAVMVDAAAAAGASGRAGSRGSSSSRSRFPTTEDLLDQVQASHEELLSGLAALRAVCLADGTWRSVEGEYLGSLLELIMVSATEQGWPWEAIPSVPMAKLLANEGFNPIVVLHCLAVYSTTNIFQLLRDQSLALNPTIATTTTSSSSSSSGMDATISSSCYSSVGSYCLEEGKVCLHYARQLLRKQASWREGEFTDAWGRAVPAPFKPRGEMLRGEVLLVKDETADDRADVLLRWFPAESLPMDPGPRFAALFAAQPRWTRKQLDPYVETLQVPGQTVESLLLKFARASQPTPAHPMVFSAR